MIKVDDISLFLGQQKPKLNVNNINIEKGLWALVGRNGSGKSTFLNVLVDMNFSKSASIQIHSKPLQTFSQNELAKTIAIVLSKVEIFGKLKGLDVLNLGRLPYQSIFGKQTDKDVQKVNEVVELLALEEIIEKNVHVLSDGEKQMLMIGRALVQDTPIILLDEPTAFLDVVNRRKIVAVLQQIAQHKLVIFSTHNIDVIETYCDGMLMIKNNELSQVSDKSLFKTTLNKLFDDEI